jgi:hypothetical protein
MVAHVSIAVAALQTNAFNDYMHNLVIDQWSTIMMM